MFAAGMMQGDQAVVKVPSWEVQHFAGIGSVASRLAALVNEETSST
jgi:hypothetical protein